MARPQRKLCSLVWLATLSTLAALTACDPASLQSGGGTGDDDGLAPGGRPGSGAPGAGNGNGNGSPDGYKSALDVGTDEFGEPLCSGELASDTFRYGLCVCGDLRMAGRLETSSYRASDPSAAGTGGGVGVNGSYASSGNADIDGALVVAGDVSPVGSVEIAGELRAGGDLSAVGNVHVAEDAYVAGDVRSIGLTVDGTLHTTAPLGTSLLIEAGATEVSDFAIDAPCGCEEAVDVAGLVAQAASDNDNAAAGLSADALDGAAGAASLSLAPGRYYLSGIQAAGSVAITVTGPTALYIDGDVRFAGRLEVLLEGDTASLDLFIAGDLGHAGRLEIGSAEAASRVRTYVAGGGTLSFAGGTDLGTALYAPNATLSTAGNLEFSGSMLVGGLSGAGRVTARYDADLQDVEDGCAPAEEPEVPGDVPGDEVPSDDEGTPGDEVPGDEVPGDEVPGHDEGTPGDDEVPGDEDPADPEAECETFMDCPSPQQCIQGTCVFVGG